MLNPEQKQKMREIIGKGFYSFRFEYDDKEGKRRFEVATWNDPMPKEEALRKISKYVSSFPHGKITDFIDNQFLLSKMEEIFDTLMESKVREVEEKLKKYKTETKEDDLLALEGKRYNEKTIKELSYITSNLRQNAVIDSIISSVLRGKDKK